MGRSDEELITVFVEGDPTGFDALLERYRRPVFAMIHSMIQDATVAEDVFQETFLKVARAAGTFDRARRFSSWLFKIADNACLDALRGIQGMRRRTVPDDALPEQPAPQTVNPERQTLDREHRRTIADAIARLPESQRQAVALREFSGFSFEEIAKILNLPLNTVLSHHHRALKNLKRILPEGGGGND